jgi:hypothetical protein
VDQALGQFQHELAAQHLDKSTLIIVSAKHGQSPIDRTQRVAISDAAYGNTPGFGTHGFEICDDTAYVWLAPELQQAKNPATGNSFYADAEAYILSQSANLHITQLLDRNALTPLYGDPFTNSRVPDFVALTQHGAICTGGSKLSEHGGWSNDDRNVALLVSAPQMQPEIVQDVTYTTQIAPTILRALHLDPRALNAVVNEGTQVLPR